MLESYPKEEKELIFDSGLEEIELLFDMIRDVRNYKITNQLAPNAKLGLTLNLRIPVSEDFKILFNRFTFSEFELKEDLSSISGELFSYNYGSMVITSGVSKEEAREKLEKEIAFEKSEIKRSEGMLNNPNFLAKAPKEKVEMEKEKLKLHLDNLKDLEEKLKKI